MVRNQGSYFLITICFLFITECSFISCNNQNSAPKENVVALAENTPIKSDTSAKEVAPATPTFSSSNMDMKTFEVKDTITGKSLGWGYDIYVDNHKAIHQPIIPGIPGNNSFKSEEQAKKTGLFILDKMKKAGTLVAITPEELDKLGITK